MTVQTASAAATYTDIGASADLPSCLYCGGYSNQPLYEGIHDRLGHAAGSWSFCRCAACGSAVLWPHPRPVDLPAFYPAVYTFTPDNAGRRGLRRWLAGVEHRLFFGPQYRAQARQVAWLTGVPARAKILDLGCGRGLRLLAFRALGHDVHGLDFQPEVVAYLWKELGIPATAGDAARADEHFPRASFDVITAFNLLEHMPGVDAVVRSAFALLRPGGWFVAAVPLVDSLQARLLGRRWVAATEAPRHLSLPSKAGLCRALLRGGFGAPAVYPDAVLNCAGMLGLSLFPGGCTTACYGRSPWLAHLCRALAAATSAAALPWCWFENHVLRLPANGLVAARKPVP
jgi:SAM-dependent methyltransferase